MLMKMAEGKCKVFVETIEKLRLYILFFSGMHSFLHHQLFLLKENFPFYQPCMSYIGEIEQA